MNDCRECRCGQPLSDHGHAPSSRKVTALHEQQMLQQVLQVSVLTALELRSSTALPQTTVNSSEGDAKDGSSSCLRARALTMNNPHRVLRGRIQLHVPTTVRSMIRIRIRIAPCRAQSLKRNNCQDTQSALLAKLLSAKRVTFEDEGAVVNSFPTEQALRQKENLKAKKEAGGAIQKRRQTVEAHSDDCGMDLAGIEADIIGFEQIGEDGRGTSSSSTSGDTDRLARWLSSRHWLFGSSAEDSVSFHDRVTACGCMETFLMQTRAKKAPGQVDVVEIFGGRAETSRILVRRYNAITGINFDLTCGFNLRNSAHVKLLFEYLHEFKPVVVVMAPPCTGLKGWAGINAAINPVGHAVSVENSTALGELQLALPRNK